MALGPLPSPLLKNLIKLCAQQPPRGPACFSTAVLRQGFPGSPPLPPTPLVSAAHLMGQCFHNGLWGTVSTNSLGQGREQLPGVEDGLRGCRWTRWGGSLTNGQVALGQRSAGGSQGMSLEGGDQA